MEDTEFRDLIIKKLENNGVLMKLKAALRAQIHDLIETDNKTEDSQTVDNDNSLNPDDATMTVALSLIQDLFDCLDLSVTKSVFQSESGDKVKYRCKTRTDLLETLKISDDDDEASLKTDDDDGDELQTSVASKEPILIKYLRKSGFYQKDNANETFIATTSTTSSME